MFIYFSNSKLSTLNSQLIIIPILEIAASNAKRNVLHVVAADVFAVFLSRNPDGLLDKTNRLVVAAATHRVDDDDVRYAAVGLHHEAQPHRALNFALPGGLRKLQVVGDVLAHVAAISKIGLGHFV